MKRLRCYVSKGLLIGRATVISWALLGVLMAMLHLFVLLHPVGVYAAAPSDTPNPDTWVTNGYVHAVAHADGITYSGGDFSTVYPITGGSAALSVSTGQPHSWSA